MNETAGYSPNQHAAMAGRNTCSTPRDTKAEAQSRCVGMAQGGEALADYDRAPTINATVQIKANRSFADVLSAAIYGGQRITRAGWNGPNQWVAAQPPDKGSKMSSPYLYLKNSQNEMVPWVPSQGDLFAQDWAVLPS